MAMLDMGAQAELFISRQYTSISMVSGGSVKALGLKAGFTGGFQYAMGHGGSAPLAGSIIYQGTQVVPPDQIKGGMIAFFNLFVRIGSEGFKLPKAFNGELAMGSGSVVVVDYLRPYSGGGMYGYMRGQLYLFAIGLSIYVGYDIGAQIGRTKVYFSGLAKVEGCVKVVMLKKCLKANAKIRVGDVPDGLPDTPAGFGGDPTPTASLNIRVTDVFGVPMPNATVSLCDKPTDNYGKCKSKRIELYSDIPADSIQVSDERSLYEKMEVRDAEGEKIEKVSFDIPGQNLEVIMAPTALVHDVFVVALPPRGYKGPLPALDLRLVNETLAYNVTERGKKSGFARAVTYRPSTDFKAAYFRSQAADDQYRVVTLFSKGQGLNKLQSPEGAVFTLKNIAKTVPVISRQATGPKKLKIVEVQLEYGKYDLVGEVVSKGSKGIIANATVTLSGGRLREPIEVETNLLGNFRFENLEYAEDYKLKIIKENFVDTKYDVKVSDFSRLFSIEVGRPTTELIVKAETVSGKPVKNFYFNFDSKQTPETTNEQGVARFDITPEKEYTILPSLREFKVVEIKFPEGLVRLGQNSSVNFILKKPRNLEITFVARSGPELSGRVVDQSGQPVSLKKENISFKTPVDNFIVKSKKNGELNVYLPSAVTAENVMIIDKDPFEKKEIALTGLQKVDAGAQSLTGIVKLNSEQPIVLATSSNFKRRLAGFDFAAGKFNFRIHKDERLIALRKELQPTLPPPAAVYMVSGDLVINGEGYYAAKGTVSVKNVLIEAWFEGNKLKTRLYKPERLTAGQIVKSNLAMRFATIQGRVTPAIIDFEEGRLQAGFSLTLSNDLTPVNCSSFSVNNQTALFVNYDGSLNFNYGQAASVDLKSNAGRECDIGKYKYSLSPQSLSIIKADFGIFGADYKLELKGGIKNYKRNYPLSFQVKSGKIEMLSQQPELASTESLKCGNYACQETRIRVLPNGSLMIKGKIAIKGQGGEKEWLTVQGVDGKFENKSTGSHIISDGSKDCTIDKAALKTEKYANTGEELFTVRFKESACIDSK